MRSLVVCIKYFCYLNNNEKPLGVFIRGHHQICVWKKKSLWLQCDNGSEKVRVDVGR